MNLNPNKYKRFSSFFTYYGSSRAENTNERKSFLGLSIQINRIN